MAVNLVSTDSPASGLDPAHAALKKATQGFESYFLHQLLVEMRKTVPKDTLLGDDAHQGEIFQDMMDQQVADSISQRGDFGMAKMMYDQMAPSVGTPATPASVDIRR
jgi:Rod binding domain-containing protein